MNTSKLTANNARKILVTNFKKGLKAEPIENVMDLSTLKYIEKEDELIINGCLFCHVFRILPTMNDTNQNRQWFQKNLYHIS